MGELVRLAFVGDRLRTGRTPAGRGAWICAAEAGCWQRGTAPERLRRAFRREVPPDATADLPAAAGVAGCGASPVVTR